VNIHRYLMGSCHYFAAATRRLWGLGLAVVVAEYRGSPSVVHAVGVGPDGAMWDARGSHSESDLLEEQADLGNPRIIRLDGEGDLRALTKAGFLNDPGERWNDRISDACDDAEAILADRLGKPPGDHCWPWQDEDIGTGTVPALDGRTADDAAP
jgi:hypothetical protein